MGDVVRQNESVAAFFSKTSTILCALVPLSNMLNLFQLCGYAAHCGRWHAAVFIGKCSSKYTWYKCVFVCSPSVHTMLEKWWSSKESRGVLKTRQEALTILFHSISYKAAFELLQINNTGVIVFFLLLRFISLPHCVPHRIIPTMVHCLPQRGLFLLLTTWGRYNPDYQPTVF